METFLPSLNFAMVKFHATILIMRVYEHIADNFLVDIETLDRLTMDTFKCARRRAKEVQGFELASEMMRTCWTANMISYLADYSVHQIILAYGYYVYSQQKRRRPKDGNDEPNGALALVTRSTMLATSRLLQLALSSVGGAVGSLVLPGWGTLAGVNFGDGVAATIVEELNEGPVV